MSYASKAASPPKSTKKAKPLKHKAFVQGVLDCRRQEGFRHMVYGKLGTMLSTFQQVHGARNCRILNHRDETAPPLLNASQMPTKHVLVEQYFHFHGLSIEFNGLSIPEGRSRKITFSFLVNANVEVEANADAVTVDLLDHHLQLSIKTCQAVSH